MVGVDIKDLGVSRIEEIPDTFELTAIQARIRQSAVTGQIWATIIRNESGVSSAAS